MISTERHSQHQAMEELQDFKLADLFAKLRLDDDEFHEWLADIGLLHGSRTCTCGNLMKRHRAGSGSIHWRCNRAMHRPSQPSIGFKVGTFFENAQLDCKTIFKLAYLWCMNLPLEYAEFETGIAHRHVSFGTRSFTIYAFAIFEHIRSGLVEAA